jgi:hypothetical protein
MEDAPTVNRNQFNCHQLASEIAANVRDPTLQRPKSTVVNLADIRTGSAGLKPRNKRQILLHMRSVELVDRTPT